jgi:hypothetical protein
VHGFRHWKSLQAVWPSLSYRLWERILDLHKNASRRHVTVTSNCGFIILLPGRGSLSFGACAKFEGTLHVNTKVKSIAIMQGRDFF